jgi:hypothetical protein
VNALVWFLLGGFTFGPFVGLVLHAVLADQVGRRALRSARSVVAAEEAARRAPFAKNSSPRRRRRSPDFQLVTRQPSDSPARPVFHRR